MKQMKEVSSNENISFDFDPTPSITNDATVFIPKGVRFEAASIDSYRRDAKKILDEQSKHLNKVGIKRLLAALLIEVFEANYFGKDNQR